MIFLCSILSRLASVLLFGRFDSRMMYGNHALSMFNSGGLIDAKAQPFEEKELLALPVLGSDDAAKAMYDYYKG